MFWDEFEVYISVGSNIGNSLEIIENFIVLLEGDKNFKEIVVSPFYLTEPVGYLNQRDFWNCVIGFKTVFNPFELLRQLQFYEFLFGRKRLIKWGPRTLDLDILLFGQLIIDEKNLKVPHKEMLQRGFVLKPLSDIAPDFIHPVTGKTINHHYLMWKNSNMKNKVLKIEYEKS